LARDMPRRQFHDCRLCNCSYKVCGLA
jgi:hypothetical protein